MNPLAEWQNFYMIIGSAAGALIGLQFVTMALVADIPISAEDSQGGEVFSTPTIVQFGAVLLLSSVLVMPWRSLGGVISTWGIVGLLGIAYTIFVARRFQVQQAYRPVFEDWFFRVALPIVGYLMLLASAWMARFTIRVALFTVAAAALLLLFLGIHSAWDNVTYLVFVKKRESK